MSMHNKETSVRCLRMPCMDLQAIQCMLKRHEALYICNRWPLPLGLIVSPLADTGTEVPKITPGAGGIVRCRRCRAYMNPFMRWSDGGRCPDALGCVLCMMGLTKVAS